jgi:nicotinamidase-related amidase
VSHLLDAAESFLLVIDAQPSFYGGAPSAEQATALARAAWLTGVAAALDIPVVVTEEDPARNGPTDPAISAALPAATPILAKRVFGAADQPDIREAIDTTGRRTAVLVGLETDVCVAHTALGLLDREFRVVVVDDATFSPGDMHAAGVRRIVAAGAERLHAKGVFYEWVRTLDRSRALLATRPELATPPGFEL